MRYSIDGRGVVIEFPDKPALEVIQALKANGFRWSPAARAWWRSRVAGAADLLGALQKMIDKAAGIRRPDGDCWTCGKPGFFRQRGAATPVLCDECAAKQT